MISCCIDAKERRYVAVTDIPEAFLHSDMNECVHMIMEGTIAESMVNSSWQYTESTYGMTRRENQCCM